MDWIAFLSFVLISAGTPGPNNIATLSMASKYGIKRTLPFIFATASGFTLLIYLCALLSSYLHKIFPIVQTPLLILGSCYMLYLAWKTYKSPTEIVDDIPRKSEIGAFLFQFMNPKLIVYILLALEAYILPVYQTNLAMLLLLAGIMSMVGCAFLFVWAIFGSAFKVIFSKYGKLTNTIMALLLVYCAVSLYI